MVEKIKKSSDLCTVCSKLRRTLSVPKTIIVWSFERLRVCKIIKLDGPRRESPTTQTKRQYTRTMDWFTQQFRRPFLSTPLGLLGKLPSNWWSSGFRDKLII